MNKSKRKLIIPSLLTILGCIAIGTGSTYSLFTSSSENNITISSGKVSVTSTASLFKTYSLKDGAVAETSTLGSFETGGTATLNGGSLELKNIVPGDKVEFKVTIKNEATISAKYRTSFLYSDDTGLFNGLNISVKEGEEVKHSTIFVDKWADLEDGTKELTISIELPETAGNEYMDKSCKLNFKVEAVQANGDVKDDTLIYTLDDFNKLEEIDDICFIR